MLPLTVMLVSVGIKRVHFRNYQSRALWYRSLFLPWHGRMNIARGASGCANGLKVVTIHHNCLRRIIGFLRREAGKPGLLTTRA